MSATAAQSTALYAVYFRGSVNSGLTETIQEDESKIYLLRCDSI
jgi:hypothetical protein